MLDQQIAFVGAPVRDKFTYFLSSRNHTPGIEVYPADEFIIASWRRSFDVGGREIGVDEPIDSVRSGFSLRIRLARQRLMPVVPECFPLVQPWLPESPGYLFGARLVLIVPLGPGLF